MSETELGGAGGGGEGLTDELPTKQAVAIVCDGRGTEAEISGLFETELVKEIVYRGGHRAANSGRWRTRLGILRAEGAAESDWDGRFIRLGVPHWVFAQEYCHAGAATALGQKLSSGSDCA